MRPAPHGWTCAPCAPVSSSRSNLHFYGEFIIDVVIIIIMIMIIVIIILVLNVVGGFCL